MPQWGGTFLSTCSLCFGWNGCLQAKRSSTESHTVFICVTVNSHTHLHIQDGYVCLHEWVCTCRSVCVWDCTHGKCVFLCIILSTDFSSVCVCACFLLALCQCWDSSGSVWCPYMSEEEKQCWGFLLSLYLCLSYLFFFLLSLILFFSLFVTFSYSKISCLMLLTFSVFQAVWCEIHSLFIRFYVVYDIRYMSWNLVYNTWCVSRCIVYDTRLDT